MPLNMLVQQHARDKSALLYAMANASLEGQSQYCCRPHTVAVLMPA
jgi:hypothetical protein